MKPTIILIALISFSAGAQKHDYLIFKDSSVKRVRIVTAVKSVHIAYWKKGELVEIPASEVIGVVRKKKSYKSTLHGVPGYPRWQGWLFELGDSAVKLVRFSRPHSTRKGIWRAEFVTVPVEQIRTMSLRSDKFKSMGAAIGAITGFAIGGMISASTYEPCTDSWFCGLAPSRDELFLEGGVVGLLGGALVGAAVGSLVTLQFKINERQEEFEKVRRTVLESNYEWRVEKKPGEKQPGMTN